MDKELREKVAEAIHDEWRKWAESLIPELEQLTQTHLPYGKEIERGNCGCKTCQRINRWKEMFVPYQALPENIKEYDRPWADRIVTLYKEAGYVKLSKPIETPLPQIEAHEHPLFNGQQHQAVWVYNWSANNTHDTPPPDCPQYCAICGRVKAGN